MKSHWFGRLSVYLLTIVLSPLLGARLAEKPISGYMAFPPIPVVTQPQPFSWIAFILMSLLVIACLSPFVVKIVSTKILQATDQRKIQSFPFWGWFALIFLLIFWIIAWTRFPLFESIQRFTFTPLWLGYILIINALSFRRTGHCCLIDKTAFFVWLFPLSAVFWWSFEYLNRFVSNWYYIGVCDLGPWKYFFQSTLPFSTVLPAVLSTSELLKTYPRISNGLDTFPKFQITKPQCWAWSLLIISVAALIGLAIWPQYLFFLVWVIPISLITGLHLLTEQPPLLNEITAGNWQRFWRLAIAGLICGFFWEMWNINSLAHWKYNVPYVQHFMLFEMPLIGYAGYLPFGVICGIFIDFIMMPNITRAPKSPNNIFPGKL
jgi:hypothetical protein